MKKELYKTWNVEDDKGNEFAYGVPLHKQIASVALVFPLFATLYAIEGIRKVQKKCKNMTEAQQMGVLVACAIVLGGAIAAKAASSSRESVVPKTEQKSFVVPRHIQKAKGLIPLGVDLVR